MSLGQSESIFQSFKGFVTSIIKEKSERGPLSSDSDILAEYSMKRPQPQPAVKEGNVENCDDFKYNENSIKLKRLSDRHHEKQQLNRKNKGNSCCN